MYPMSFTHKAQAPQMLSGARSFEFPTESKDLSTENSAQNLTNSLPASLCPTTDVCAKTTQNTRDSSVGQGKKADPDQIMHEVQSHPPRHSATSVSPRSQDMNRQEYIAGQRATTVSTISDGEPGELSFNAVAMYGLHADR